MIATIARYYTYGFPIHEYAYVIAVREGKILYVTEENKNGTCSIFTRDTMDLTGNGKTAFSFALYVLAKQKIKDFKKLYKILEKEDVEYFKIAKKVLKKIQKEYKF